MKKTVTLRQAVLDDCNMVFEWRNTEITRRYFFDVSLIPYNEHRKWFSRSIAKNDRDLFIIENEKSEGCGVVRFDYLDDTCEISIYLNPKFHNRGIGTAAIKAACQWLKESDTVVTNMIARVKEENKASLIAFTNAGFRIDHLCLKFKL